MSKEIMIDLSKIKKNRSGFAMIFKQHSVYHLVGNGNSLVQEPEIKIKNSGDIIKILQDRLVPQQLEIREYFFVLCFNRANCFVGMAQISEGGTSGTLVDPKLIVALVMTLGAAKNASGVVLCHNHPSGMMKPSDADIRLTHKIKEALKYIEISFLDHIIINSMMDKHYSFADNGLL